MAGRRTACDEERQRGRARGRGGSENERDDDAPMAKASDERSRGAVWKAVSKTPSTGAKRMSQNVRANCRRRRARQSTRRASAREDEVGTHDHGEDAVL